MGIFDFLTDSGDKNVTPPKASPGVDAAALNRAMNSTLEKVLEKHNLNVDNANISYDGGKVVIRGEAQNQATREKVILAVGNIRGISSVDDQMTVLEEAPQATFYTVASGDTLGKIAKNHYGNAGKYPVIFEANRPLLKDPNLIYPGQVLRIPPLED